MRKLLLVTCALFLAIAPRLQAQQLRVELNPLGGDLINDVDEATVAMHPATPFLESSSLLLADISLEKIDVPAVVKWIHDLSGRPASKEDSQAISGFVDSLKGGGVSHVYVEAAARSPLDGGPLVIVPCQNPAVVQGLATVLIQRVSDPSQQKVHVGDKVVVAGAAKAIDRVIARQGVDRPDLILPLKGPDLLDHTIVISLPAEAKEELSALWPEQLSAPPFPNPISPRQIAVDIQRVIVTLKLPPDPEMLVRIETMDAGASQRIRELVDDVLKIAGDAGSKINASIEMNNVNLRATPEAFVEIAATILAPTRASNQRVQRMNSMKQIGLAMHNYHANEKHFPPRVFTDAQGQPLLSWRVAILPFIDQAAMYGAMRLDQPWDSEANRMASSTMILVYGDDPQLVNKTTFRAPMFPGSLWEGDGTPKGIRDIRDGTSNTIGVIDAPVSAAIEWANPEPWVLSEDDPMSDVFGDRPTAAVLLLDGSVRILNRAEMTNEKLKAMLTIAGGEPINP